MFTKMVFETPMAEMLFMSIALFVLFANQKKQSADWKNIVKKMAIAVLLFVVVMVLEWEFVDFNTGSTALEGIFCIVATFLFGTFAMNRKPEESFYGMVWTYLLMTVGMQVVMPICATIHAKGTLKGFLTRTLPVYLVILIGLMAVWQKIIIPELLVHGKYRLNRQKLMLSTLDLCLFLLLSNYQVIFWMLGFEPAEMSRMITIYRLILGIAAIGVLLLQNSLEKKQHVEHELDMIQQLWYRQQDQYRLSQENIDLINRKCHDLKHQMAAIRHMKDDEEINRQLKEMEHSVMIYDSVVKTGNPVLDTVLTEKSLYCEEHQIVMTCMADGSHLDFIDKVDLYTMFGNAIDNAVESVMKLKDKEKRVIQVSVFNEKKLLMIRVKNHCEDKLKFVEGLPVTTKKDKGYHGFGLKSMQHTAEKYGGTVVCQQLDNAFVLQILLPIP